MRAKKLSRCLEESQPNERAHPILVPEVQGVSSAPVPAYRDMLIRLKNEQAARQVCSRVEIGSAAIKEGTS